MNHITKIPNILQTSPKLLKHTWTLSASVYFPLTGLVLVHCIVVIATMNTKWDRWSTSTYLLTYSMEQSPSWEANSKQYKYTIYKSIHIHVVTTSSMPTFYLININSKSNNSINLDAKKNRVSRYTINQVCAIALAMNGTTKTELGGRVG
jgi:hypothetical protein